MIFEGSYETEDWSNDAKNSALTNYLLFFLNSKHLF